MPSCQVGWCYVGWLGGGGDSWWLEGLGVKGVYG